MKPSIEVVVLQAKYEGGQQSRRASRAGKAPPSSAYPQLNQLKLYIKAVGRRTTGLELN